MKIHLVIFTFCYIEALWGWSDNKQRRFPKSFLFGTASSSYQVEGAWEADGKSESIWDKFLHENPELITDGRNGDEASDSYHQYETDVEMLRKLGVDFYRFSISWPRVLPTGFTNVINEKGFQYYDKLINELLKYNIEPMVTMYHFDLPQRLQDLGGWTNPLVQYWFEDYSRVLYERYADRVKYWITINQPQTVCVTGYGDGIFAPGIKATGIADYVCVKNVLLAHAKAYRLYEKDYKGKHRGTVGITVSINWSDPINNSTKNVKAVERYREFDIGLYVNPIWSKEGDFPSLVKEIVREKSKKQGFSFSRLPSLNADEIKLLKGSSDFLGMNHYTTSLIEASKRPRASPSYEDDLNVEVSQSDQWMDSASFWLKGAPYGLYKACIHLNMKYNYPKIIITEHGWSTAAGLRDRSRIRNLKEYLSALLLALEDGTQVMGYTAWSLMDNVEWIAGTSERFGLFEVNFDSPKKTRTARSSALFYRRVIETRVVEDWEPEDLNMNISDRRTKKNAKEEL